MNKDLTDLYQHKAEETSKTLVSLRNRSRVFILTEIGSFLVAIGFVVLYTLLDNAAWTLFCALVALLFYLYIRRRDVLNDRKINKGEALLLVYQNEIAYQKGDYSGFEAGGQYVSPQHSYTFDMDVFGTGSLFQRMNRTIQLEVVISWQLVYLRSGDMRKGRNLLGRYVSEWLLLMN